MDLLRDRPADLVLDGQDVAQLPVILLRPQLRLVAGADQLHADADPVGVPADAPLHREVHAELPPDLRDALRAALVGHGRGTGDHSELVRGDAPEVGDRLLGEAVAEVLLLRVAAEV